MACSFASISIKKNQTNDIPTTRRHLTGWYVLYTATTTKVVNRGYVVARKIYFESDEGRVFLLAVSNQVSDDARWRRPVWLNFTKDDGEKWEEKKEAWWASCAPRRGAKHESCKGKHKDDKQWFCTEQVHSLQRSGVLGCPASQESREPPSSWGWVVGGREEAKIIFLADFSSVVFFFLHRISLYSFSRYIS